jgi:uncharacterized membrane protein
MAVDPMPERHRLFVAIPVGVVAGLAAALVAPWELSVLAGWDVIALVIVLWVWLLLGRTDAARTKELATREDPGRGPTRVLLLAASVASIAGVLMALHKASNSDGAERALLTVGALATVLLSWSLVHTLYALRYAHLYYGEHPGGIDFKNSDEPPTYADFAYVAFTVGMTFQISDTDIQLAVIRRVVLQHALLSYLFGTVIVASAINVIAGFVK